MEIDLERDDLIRGFALLTLICMIFAGVYAGYSILTKMFNSGGTVTTLGFNLYEDAKGTIPVTYIDFGEINANSVKNSPDYYLVSDELETLSNVILNYGNFTPSGLASYATLTWNYTTQFMTANQSLPVKFTLDLSLGTLTNFTDFTFVIYLEGF